MKNRDLSRLSSLDKGNLNIFYEQIRKEALGISLNHYRSQGLTLLIQKGVAVWIKAWTDYPSFSLPAKKREAKPSERNLPVNLHTEVAILLTNMALNVFKEARTI